MKNIFVNGITIQVFTYYKYWFINPPFKTKLPETLVCWYALYSDFSNVKHTLDKM